MPRRIELTVSDFKFLEREMLAMGYRLKSHRQLKIDFKRLDLSAPRKKKGREATFLYGNNFLQAVAHTTFDLDNQEWREEDLGWHLIKEKDRIKYFSKPLRRTKNFISNFLMRARVNRWRIDNRPICPECKRFMEIKTRWTYNHEEFRWESTGQYFWGCLQKDNHQDNRLISVGWDDIGPKKEIPKDLGKYVKEMRRRVASHRRREKLLGIKRRSMRFIRKAWSIGKPENLET